MKRIIKASEQTALVFIAILLAAFSVSCGRKNAETLSRYEVHGYYETEDSQSKESDFLGYRLYDVEICKKKNVKNRNVTLFGKDYDMRYLNTEKNFMRGCGADRFETSDGYNTIMVIFNEKTGKLIGYDYGSRGRLPGFIAPINEDSTEKDYADLARSAILECTGIDCGEWEYDVDTYIYYTTYNYSAEDWKSGFLNFNKDDPEFDAEYTFRFYKTISGVPRADDVSAVIGNDGKVLKVRGEVYDKAFWPFSSVEIDAEALFDRFDSRYSAPGPEICHKTKIFALAAEDGLWVDVRIKGAYYDEEDGSAQWDEKRYVVKVAGYAD